MIQDSSVGIATRYGLDGPGIESRWGENFRTHPDRPWDPPSLLYSGYQVFPGGKNVVTIYRSMLGCLNIEIRPAYSPYTS